MDVGTLAPQLTRAVGIEPWLQRLVAPGAIPTARLLMLTAAMLWFLTLFALLSALLLRHLLRKVSPGPHTERMTLAARMLRRVSHVYARIGHVMLAIGAVLALGAWLAGETYPWQPLVLGALGDLGVMQPCRMFMGTVWRSLRRRNGDAYFVLRNSRRSRLSADARSVPNAWPPLLLPVARVSNR